MVTELRHRDTTLPRMPQAQQWAMKCHVIMLDTTGTTYTLYGIEERRKQSKKKKIKAKSNEKKEQMKEKKRRIEETNCRAPLPQARRQTLEKGRAGKGKKITKTPLLVNRVSESFFFQILDIFPRNFSIFHIFLFFFSKYWNINELDIFASGEFHE